MVRIASVLGLCLIVTALTAGGRVTAQSAPQTAPRFSHVGVVVPNIDKAIGEYVRVMGFPTPKVNEYPQPAPSGARVEFKVATLYMPNFFIEVIQPLNQVGPYYEDLRAHGMSIQHVGLAVSGAGPVDEQRAAWEALGGRWTLGAKGGNYAYVNFSTPIGTTLELNRGTAGAPGALPPAVAAGDALPPLAALNVGHVGVAATDTAAAVNGLAKVLGIAAPRVMEYKDSQYPPATQWNKEAFLRLSMLNQGGIGFEVIESVGGPTPWSEYVTRHKGTAAQHLAITVGNRMDEMISDLVAKGGRWTNGKPGGNYAYVDFSDTLGLIFELNGTSKSGAGK